MPTSEVVRDAPAKPLAPIDDSVLIPKSVRDAAAKADSYYQTPEPDPAEAAAAAAEAARAAAAQAAADGEPPKPAPKPAKTKAKTAAAAPEPPPAPAPTPVDEGQWEHRYLSMKGRFDAAQQTIGSMQEQMTQLGDELMRTQALLQGRGPQQNQQPQPPAPPAKLITPEDEQAFGTELIGLAQRAAQEALGPEINALREQNAELSRKAQVTAQRGVGQFMDRELPSWREINGDPRFINWLRLRDVYSGRVRQQMLNEAYRAANAPQVKAFFDGFIRDEAVTGSEDLVPQDEQQPQPPAPARQPAVPLSSLAAPGRAKPASGDTPGPADKPIFTRTQISRFYTDVRRGLYAGRETEKNTMENQIFVAQREGRVR